MKDLLLHTQTRAALSHILESHTHAFLFMGPEGAGKMTLAKAFIAEKLRTSKLDNYPYFSSIKPEKNAITIEQIRNLQRFLQLKTAGKHAVRRGVVIEDAHLMTIEAQNALLKSLEEPPADTVIALTAIASPNIKPTIISRVQVTEILPVDEDSAVRYFSEKKHPKSEINKAFLISGGYAGIMSALLEESSDHLLLEQISKVKDLLRKSLYERLASVDDIAKQKESLVLFMQGCRLVCSAALAASARKNDAKQLTHWHKALSAIYDSESALNSNPNTKLLLTNLMLNL